MMYHFDNQAMNDNDTEILPSFQNGATVEADVPASASTVESVTPAADRSRQPLKYTTWEIFKPIFPGKDPMIDLGYDDEGDVDLGDIYSVTY